MIPAAEFRDLLPKAGEVADGLSHAEFNWRPTPGTWSIAECLAHLNVTDELYAGKIRTAIRTARESGITSSGPFRLGWLESRLVDLMEPPYRLKTRAPKQFRPRPEHRIERVLDDWRITRVEFLQLAAEADGLHLTRVRVPSPATYLISLSLLGAFAFAAAHDRRHLWQAAQVRSMIPKQPAAAG